MGYYARAEQRASPENPTTNLANPAEWLLDAIGARPSMAGVRVNPERAIGIPAFSSGVRLLSETPASLPLPVYRRRRPRGKERVEGHKLYRVLHDQANPEMTAFTFREVTQQHAVTWGDIFAEKELDGRGEVIGLWPLNPANTRAIRKDGVKWIVTKVPENGGLREILLPAARVFHIPFFSADGLNGRSLVQVHRDTLGTGLAQEEFTGKFFSQGAASKGALTTDKKLTDEAWKRLEGQRDTFISGLSNAHRIAILEQGLKWDQIGIPPEDAQLLESRKWTVEDISRILRVPPHLIQHLSPAPARANVEVQSLEFVIFYLMPWLVRWEQAIRQQLVPARERDEIFAEFVVSGLLRGDTETRYEAYQVGRQNGFLSANDVRTLENMPLIDAPGADDYHVQLNMATLGAVSAMSGSDLREAFRGMFARMMGGPGTEAIETEAPRALPAPQVDDRADRERREARSLAARRRLQRQFVAIFREAANRLVRRETIRGRQALRDVLEAAGVEAFVEWLGEFYTEITPFAEDVIRGPLESYSRLVLAEVADEIAFDGELDAETFIASYAETFAARHLQSSRLQLEALVRGQEAEEAREAVEARYGEWEEKRPDKVASRETVRAGGALAIFGYRQAGVTEKRWRAIGESCDYCTSLDGTVVGIDETFIGAGQELDPGVEGVEPLRVSFDVGHPPAHSPGCDCLVSANL